MPLPKSNSYTIEDIFSLPEGDRAELIDGQIYNMTPPSRQHQKLVSELTQSIGTISSRRMVPVRSILLHSLSF